MILEINRHLHFARSLPVDGIAIATGSSSLCRVSTVTVLLSFISVARATQPRLIDGISALPQQRGQEVGLLAIDFQPLQTSASPHHPDPPTRPPSLPTLSHLVLTAAPVHGTSIQYSMHTYSRCNIPCKQTRKHSDQTNKHRHTQIKYMYASVYVLVLHVYAVCDLMTVTNAVEPRQYG